MNKVQNCIGSCCRCSFFNIDGKKVEEPGFCIDGADETTPHNDTVYCCLTIADGAVGGAFVRGADANLVKARKTPKNLKKAQKYINKASKSILSEKRLRENGEKSFDPFLHLGKRPGEKKW
uniref:Uncharacterized protein n=1 Tax=Romanomermis culicivorax TaxID=13658 RepID=A0A915KFD8_ROMCU